MKNIFKMTGFCLLLVVILWKTDRIFEVKYGDGIYGMTKFYDLEDHTVDTWVEGRLWNSAVCFGRLHSADVEYLLLFERSLKNAAAGADCAGSVLYGV